MADSGLTKFAKKLTGYDDGWGIPTSGLVVFLVVLLIATVMLVVNGVYFIKVYDGSTDQDLNNYWSRGGALALAIFNIIFSILLFIEFVIILSVLVKKNSLNDPECLKAITKVDPVSGLPDPKVVDKIIEAKLAIATADRTKTGYVTGISGPGPLSKDGLYAGPEYLTTKTEYNELRDSLLDKRDKYALYDIISKFGNTPNDINVRANEYARENSVPPYIFNPLINKTRELYTAAGGREPEITSYRAGLLDTNPPFDPDGKYGKDSNYNYRKLDDQLRLLSENPNPIVSENILKTNILNPVPLGRTPFYDLRRRT
jgi:hypothetical protein